MLWNAIDFIVNLVEILLIYYFLKNFYEHRINNKFYVVGLLFLQTVILTATNVHSQGSSAIAFLFNIFCIAFLSYLIFKENIVMIFIPALLWIIVIGIVEFTVVNLLCFGFNITTDIFLQDNAYKLMLLIISRIILIFLIRDCQKYIVVSNALKKIYIYEISVVLLFDIAILLTIPYMFATTISLGVSTVVISLVITIFSILLIKLINIIMEYSIKEAEYDAHVQYLKSMHNFIQQLRAQRHDFNHHIGCIHGLMDTEKFHEAKEYMEQLLLKTEELNALVNTNNPYVTAILNHKLSIAKDEDINLEVNVDIPLELHIEPVDLSIILGNALDNAIEACRIVEGYKYIAIDIYEKLNYLIINIVNANVSEEHDYTEGTTKIDKDNHGFGLKNIQYVVNKYQGKMEIDGSKGDFILHIILNNLQ